MRHGDARSVLLIHPGALGDVLLALPAMRTLRRRYPSCRLLLMAGSEVGRLLQACRVVDDHLSIDSGDLAGLFAGGRGLSLTLRQWLDQCDAAVGWLQDRDAALRATLRRAGIPQIDIGSPTPQRGVHQTERFLDVVDRLGGGAATDSELALPGSLKQAGTDLLRSLGIEGRSIVLCHPGSGSSAKCVRPEIMADVIRRVHALDVTPIIVGGPADDEVVQRLIEQRLHDVPVMQHRPLEILAGVLVHARLLIGHDSGVTHLSAALHVPTVALFGPTDPVQWAPQGRHVFVLRGNPCTCQDLEQVRACVERPCLPHSPESIVDTVRTVLTRYHSVTKS